MYTVPVRRTQIMLPEELRAKADARAAREGQSFAAIVREALEAYLADEPDEDWEAEYQEVLRRHLERVRSDPAPPDAPTDGAINHDFYLYGGPKVEP